MVHFTWDTHHDSTNPRWHW